MAIWSTIIRADKDFMQVIYLYETPLKALRFHINVIVEMPQKQSEATTPATDTAELIMIYSYPLPPSTVLRYFNPSK